MDLRSIMFQDVYLNPVAKKEESKGIKMLTELYAVLHRTSGGNVRRIQGS